LGGGGDCVLEKRPLKTGRAATDRGSNQVAGECVVSF